MLNRGVIPVIPEKGSVGASGDLAPLAHLALDADRRRRSVLRRRARCRAAKRWSKRACDPSALEAKEGLALLNGTQAMHAVGGLALLRAKRLARVADVAGAMSLEALKGTPTAFDPRIHNARPHPGQQAVAEHLRQLLRDSEIRQSHLDGRSARPGCLQSCAACRRCTARFAARWLIAKSVFEIESASATDNPLVFAENGDVLSGGNFHGAPLALALDYAAIAVTDLMSISERRTDRLVNPDLNEGLAAISRPARRERNPVS